MAIQVFAIKDGADELAALLRLDTLSTSGTNQNVLLRDDPFLINDSTILHDSFVTFGQFEGTDANRGGSILHFISSSRPDMLLLKALYCFAKHSKPL